MAGNYLSRDEIEVSPVRTRDVEAFGGTVMVKEIDALMLRHLMASGAFETRPDGTSQLDFNKLPLVSIAAHCIVDPETKESLFSDKDMKMLSQKSGFDIIAIVTAAMEAAGLEIAEEEQPEKN